MVTTRNLVECSPLSFTSPNLTYCDSLPLCSSDSVANLRRVRDAPRRAGPKPRATRTTCASERRDNAASRRPDRQLLHLYNDRQRFLKLDPRVAVKQCSRPAEHPGHEPAIAWLLGAGYVQMTVGGPTPTVAGSNLYRLMALDAGFTRFSLGTTHLTVSIFPPCVLGMAAGLSASYCRHAHSARLKGGMHETNGCTAGGPGRRLGVCWRQRQACEPGRKVRDLDLGKQVRRWSGFWRPHVWWRHR